jgi:hypothetical protein
VLVVLLQVPDRCASSEVTTLVIGSRSTQPITLEMMRIPMIEHVFIMSGELPSSTVFGQSHRSGIDSQSAVDGTIGCARDSLRAAAPQIVERLTQR